MKKKVTFFYGLIVVIGLYNLIVVDAVFAKIGIVEEYDTFFSFDSVEIVASLIFAPIIEEILFRTHLSPSKKYFFGFPLMLLVCGIVFFELLPIITILFALLIVGTIIFYDKVYDIISANYTQPLFILTSILFCLFHISYLESYNFSIFKKVIVLLINYLPISILLGIIRRKFKLANAIFGHMMYNLILLGGNTLISL